MTTYLYNNKIICNVQTTTTSASAYYDLWASQIGVSNTGTDMALDGDDQVWETTWAANFMNLYGWGAHGFFSSELALGFYTSTISNTVTASYSVPNYTRVFGLADKPDILLILKPDVDCRTENVKMRSSASVTILTGTVRNYVAMTDMAYFAIRIENNKITIVVEDVNATGLNCSLDGFDASDNLTSNEIFMTLNSGDIKIATLDVKQRVLTCSLTENLALTDFNFRVYDMDTGALLLTHLATAPGNVDIDVSTFTQSCYSVTAAPKAFLWKASNSYALGDIVFPSDVITHGYYYKRVVIGTSGSTEPIWANTIGNTVNDGAVNNAWQCVDVMSQPLTLAPIFYTIL